MEQTIQIKIKQVYGKDTIYPWCDTSLKFAQLMGQTTLTKGDIKIIGLMGYKIIIVYDEIKL